MGAKNATIDNLKFFPDVWRITYIHNAVDMWGRTCIHNAVDIGPTILCIGWLTIINAPFFLLIILKAFSIKLAAFTHSTKPISNSIILLKWLFIQSDMNNFLTYLLSISELWLSSLGYKASSSSLISFMSVYWVAFQASTVFKLHLKVCSIKNFNNYLLYYFYCSLY